ncbi:unnamed protein product, partial [Staurois parvus]
MSPPHLCMVCVFTLFCLSGQVCQLTYQIAIQMQRRTDNSWDPRAIGDHRSPVPLPKFKKAYEKGTRGISWGPKLTPGPQAVPEFPNGQSAPV